MLQSSSVQSWDWVDNSQTPNNGDQTIDNSIFGNSTSTEGPDPWGGFFRSLLTTGVGYAIQKDAVTSGVAPKYSTSQGQPVYMGQPAPAAGGISMQAIMMMGAVGLGLVLILKK